MKYLIFGLTVLIVELAAEDLAQKDMAPFIADMVMVLIGCFFLGRPRRA